MVDKKRNLLDDPVSELSNPLHASYLEAISVRNALSIAGVAGYAGNLGALAGVAGYAGNLGALAGVAGYTGNLGALAGVAGYAGNLGALAGAAGYAGNLGVLAGAAGYAGNFGALAGAAGYAGNFGALAGAGYADGWSTLIRAGYAGSLSPQILAGRSNSYFENAGLIGQNPFGLADSLFPDGLIGQSALGLVASRFNAGLLSQEINNAANSIQDVFGAFPNIYGGFAQQALEELASAYVDQTRIPSIADFSYLFENVGRGVIQPKTWALNALQKGLWTIDDEALIEHLANNLHTASNPEEYICYYYSNNRWAKLADIVEKWTECEFIRERYPRLKRAFELLRLTQDAESNFKDTIMDTLILQLDGIKGDIERIISPDTLTRLDINGDFTKHKYGIETNLRNQRICSFISKRISHDYAITFHDVICHGVFMNTNKFKEQMRDGDSIIKFNRNIIAHGHKDYSDYGTTENVIRAFLYLDFMIKIISKLNDETYH